MVCDPSGKLTELLTRLRRAVEEKLERYRTPDGCYGWRPKGGGRMPEIEVSN